MKVSVVGLRGIPDVLGGVETHCEELLPRLVRANPDIKVRIIGRRPYVTEDTTYKGVDITSVYAPSGKNTEAFVATFLSVLKAWRKGTDVMHIHAIGPSLLAPMARLMGMRVLMTHHGEDFQRAKWSPLAKTALKLGEWLGVHFSHRVVAVSPSLQRGLQARYPKLADRIVYVPNGKSKLADDIGDGQAVLDEFGLKKKDYILVAARLVPEKGIDYLIEAHERSGSDKMLVIAGAEMHGSDYFDGLVKHTSPKVKFTGRVLRSKLATLYRHAALFVLPSYHEGLPISALEALSVGAPVLLSDIDANTDLGLPDRHYFPVGDTNALAHRLEASDFADLDTSKWDGAAAFDWDTIADSTADLYRDLVGLPMTSRADRMGGFA